MSTSSKQCASIPFPRLPSPPPAPPHLQLTLSVLLEVAHVVVLHLDRCIVVKIPLVPEDVDATPLGEGKDVGEEHEHAAAEGLIARLGKAAQELVGDLEHEQLALRVLGVGLDERAPRQRVPPRLDKLPRRRARLDGLRREDLLQERKRELRRRAAADAARDGEVEQRWKGLGHRGVAGRGRRHRRDGGGRRGGDGSRAVGL